MDQALFYAILLDYDISNTSALFELEETLDCIAEDAKTHEDTAFDPSGSHVVHDTSNSDESRSRAKSWHGDIRSEDTGITAASDSLRSLNLQSSVSAEQAIDDGLLNDDSRQNPEAMLMKMFPSIKTQDVSYIFRKSGNNVEKSIEELLNLAFLEDKTSTSGEVTHRCGIDAFDASFADDQPKGRKARRKRKAPLRRTSSTPGLDSEPPKSNAAAMNRWDQSKEDVDFITQRTHLPVSTVSSLYHRSGGSLAATVRALSGLPATASENPYLEDASPTLLEEHSSALRHDFPSLTIPQCQTLVHLTHPSTASAHELARAMSRVDPSSSALHPTYTPIDPSPPSTPATAGARPVLPPSPSMSPAQLLFTKSNARANATKSYHASRFGKPLMVQAAGYYSSVARSASACLLAQESAAADARVTAQSKAGEIDLHGLHVKDAVQVARDRTAAWWEGGPREWAREGKVMKGSGLRVIVGMGRHSEGGKGRLGPAVGKALAAEGWKLEIGQGVLTVVGRVRR